MINKTQIILILKQILSEFPDTYTKRIKMKGNEELMYAINKYLPIKVNSDKYSFKTKIYWLINNLNDFPKCIVCGRELSDKNIKNMCVGYHKCCSQICAKNSKQRKELYKLTCLKHFGVENVSQSENIKNKKMQTTLKNYGVDNPSKACIIKNKIKDTNLKKYGFNCTFQNEEVKEKSKNTLLKKYNVEHPLQNREIRIKAQQKYNYKGICFDSKPELELYLYLLDNNIKFEYQPNISFNYEYNGKVFMYFPDFIIDGQICEIKGKHFFKEDGTMQNPWSHQLDEIYEAKHQCMINNNVRIILDDDEMILTASQYIKLNYRKNYLEQFKRIKK